MQSKDVFKKLHRPIILLKTAKIGLKSYIRERDLKRILGLQSLPKTIPAMNELLVKEKELEAARKIGSAAYDLKLHILTMTALLQEANSMPKISQKY